MSVVAADPGTKANSYATFNPEAAKHSKRAVGSEPEVSESNVN